MKNGKTSNSKNRFEDLGEYLYLGSISNKEIRGIKGTSLKGNLLTVNVLNDFCSKGHKNIRKIRVNKNFNLKHFNNLINTYAKYSLSYIGDKMKNDIGFTFRELRHLLASHQLETTRDLSQVSRTLGHNSKKNLAYYIDWDFISQLFGDDYAQNLLMSTEHSFNYTLIKLAVRIETKTINEKLDALLEIMSQA